MKTYRLTYAASLAHAPEHPERTGYRAAGTGMEFDLIFRVWPNRASLLKTLELQSKRELRWDDWRAWNRSAMAKRNSAREVET